MKKILNWILILTAAAALTACLGDNYQQPDAAFHGFVIDAESGEYIPQDLGGFGSQIEVLEWTKGEDGKLIYPRPDIRRLNFKTDGSYRDNNFFNGDYRVQFNLANFNPATVKLVSKDSQIWDDEETVTDEETGITKTTKFKVIHLDGDTEMNIEAVPWCRVIVKDIHFDEVKQRVFAQFEVEATTDDPVKEVGLFCSSSPHVSYSINDYGASSSKGITVNKVLGEPTLFTVKMPLEVFQDADSGKDYYVRAGALTSVTDARWNYAAPVKVHIDVKPVETKPLGLRWDLFDKKYEEFWMKCKHKSLDQLYFDDKDFKSGDGCYVAVSGPVVDEPFRFTTYMMSGVKMPITPAFDISSIPEEGCHMLLTLYVSDASKLVFDEQSQIELNSASEYDTDEIGWTFGQFRLRNGWQTLDLSMPLAAEKRGEFDRQNITWFRFYHKDFEGNLTIKFDEIRFYYKTMIESCDNVAGWGSVGPITLDESDVKEGEGAISTTNSADGIRLWKTWGGEYLPTTVDGGHFQFWLYVSDASAFNGVDNQVEIGSGGRADANELHWTLPALTDGWNLVDLKLDQAASVGGEFNPKAMNWFRIYSGVHATAGSITVKVDRLRFYKEGADLKLSDFAE